MKQKPTKNTSIICMREPNSTKPRKFQCKKCNFVWIETNPKIIKVWCPKDNLIMKKSNAGNKNSYMLT